MSMRSCGALVDDARVIARAVAAAVSMPRCARSAEPWRNIAPKRVNEAGEKDDGQNAQIASNHAFCRQGKFRGAKQAPSGGGA